MILEMNVGIICGCLSGVKPVMAALFPTLFGTSHRSKSEATVPTYGLTAESTTNQSFAFKSLSGTSSKSRNKHIEHAMSTEPIHRFVDDKQANSAWASSNDNDDGNPLSVPANSIGVQQSIAVQKEELDMITPGSRRASELNGLSDADSEEWILDGRIRPHRV